MEQLIKKLGSVNANERQLAVFELGQTKNQSAVPYLISALADSDLMVRIYAIQGLRDIPDRTATSPLCDLLESNLGEPLIVSNACRALGEIGDSDSIPILLKMLKNPEPFTRYDAAQALGEIGDPAAIAHLEAIFDDKAMPEREDEDGNFVDTIYSVGEQAKRAVEMIKESKL